MFNNKNKTILLTGCAGFIGSNFVPYFLNKYPNYNLEPVMEKYGKKYVLPNELGGK